MKQNILRKIAVLMIAVFALAAFAPIAGAQDAGGSGFAPGIQHYTVQRGDTLYRIALRFGLPMQQIQSANNIFNPNIIYVGQTLLIPGSYNPNPQPVPQPQPQPQPGANNYVVRPGDTLARIARSYGVNLWSLAQHNRITNVNLIYVGQVLNIPDFTIQS